MSKARNIKVSVIILLVMAMPIMAGDKEPLFKTDKLSKVTHYMHEVYEHYTVSGIMVRQNRIREAVIHIKTLEYYIKRIPDMLPAKNKDGSALDKRLFLENAKDLKKFSTRMKKVLESESWKGGKPLPPPDIVTKTCGVCHKNVKIPPPW